MFRRWLSPTKNAFADAIVLCFIGAVGTYIGYAFTSRDKPVEVIGRELLTLTPNPHLAETFDYATSFIRKEWCETKVNRWFVDSDGHNQPQPPIPYSMRTDGLFYPQTNVTHVEIPGYLPSGPTQWCFRPEWKCNWTQNEILPPGPIIGPEECITFWVNNPSKPMHEFDGTEDDAIVDN